MKLHGSLRIWNDTRTHTHTHHIPTTLASRALAGILLFTRLTCVYLYISIYIYRERETWLSRHWRQNECILGNKLSAFLASNWVHSWRQIECILGNKLSAFLATNWVHSWHQGKPWLISVTWNIHTCDVQRATKSAMGWLRLVGSLKS